MWNKVYLVVLAIFLLPMIILTYYTGSWLESVDAPRAVAENYEYFANISRTFLWISTIVLLIIGNVVLWMTGKAWALWTTFLYFALFVVVRYFWLDRTFDQYQQSNGLARNAISVEPLIAVVLCALAAAVVFFNQYLVKRMHEKMYPLNEVSESENAVNTETDQVK